jgi:very-short-patch-repair endonuclease
VRARQPIPEALVRLARLQSGVVSREQALGTGFGSAGLNRLVRSGIWVRVSPGIYLTAAVPISWPALAWSGVLIGGDTARLGGQAAAFLHDLIPTPPDQIEVLVTAGRAAPAVSGAWYFRRERAGVRSRGSVGSPPRLSVEDTVLDLVDDPDCTPRDAVNWLTMAVQSRRTTPDRILRAARGRRFLRQRALLQDVLADVCAGVRSPIELDYLRNVERGHGLPVGTRQAARRNTEVDVLYEDYGLLVELDGRLGHTGMGRFRDMRRDNRATTDGLATLRYGKADVFGTPCEVAQEVSANLARLGWRSVAHHCWRCRRAA